jgi:thymidylate kinase
MAGKTTLIERLARYLSSRGCSTFTSKCWLQADALNERIHDLAFEQLGEWRDVAFPDPEFMRPFNVYKSAHILIDSMLAGKTEAAYRDAGVRLQDRHWFSQYCSNEFFNPGEGLLAPEWVATSSPSFTLKVYLTCSAAARRERARRRSAHPRTRLHAYMNAHLDELGAFDEFCLDLVAKDGRWLVIRTDEGSEDEVAAHVGAELLRRRQ